MKKNKKKEKIWKLYINLHLKRFGIIGGDLEQVWWGDGSAH